jgi:very-short-patch-repair endonuclease
MIDIKFPPLLGEGLGGVPNRMKNTIQYRHSSVGRARAFRRNMTNTEQKLWSRLRGDQLGCYFRRQVPIGKYIVDFMCRRKKLVIEVDGFQHSTASGLSKDRQRDKFLKSEGYSVLRFNNSEVSTNIDGVVDVIHDELHNPLWSPYEGDGD